MYKGREEEGLRVLNMLLKISFIKNVQSNKPKSKQNTLEETSQIINRYMETLQPNNKFSI